MRKFIQLVDKKTVALVGNASSLLETSLGQEIDACDLVIRMNAGFVRDPKSQGERTDILFTSSPIDSREIIEKMDPSIVVWATSKRQYMPADYANQTFAFYKHPLLEWWRLKRKLQARPSTGTIAANYLAARTAPLEVRVFGFDHFKSKTFYESRADIGPHSPRREADYFDTLYSSGRFVCSTVHHDFEMSLH